MPKHRAGGGAICDHDKVARLLYSSVSTYAGLPPDLEITQGLLMSDWMPCGVADRGARNGGPCWSERSRPEWSRFR